MIYSQLKLSHFDTEQRNSYAMINPHHFTDIPKSKSHLLGHYHNNIDRKYFHLRKNEDSIDIIHKAENGYYNFINRQRLV